MARIDVVMPQMGESIAEGTMSRWLKKVGDEVKRDEAIFEISTDKVDAEIPSPSSGVLAEILVQEGETVAVQTVVARLETEKGASISVPADAPAPVAATATPEAAAPAAAAPASAPSPGSSAASGAAPSGGENGASFEDRVRTRSSPLVRKMAAEHGVEISTLQGSGIAGRVTKKDLLGYLESGPPAAPAPAAAPAAGASMYAPGGLEQSGPLPQPWAGDRVEPMSKMRGIISDRMVQSRRTSAHVSSFFEADFTRVARIRAKHRGEFERKTGEKLTYMPFILSSVVQGLKQFPIMNAAVAGRDVIYRKAINLSVAVAVDWGLLVPVIKNADDLSLTGLTRALNDLANRARTKKLLPAETDGGTFTITNPGVFGSLMGTPIINQPQVAILGIGAIEKRAKVITGADGEDTIAIRTCAHLSISFDHRLIDGAVADEFMAYVKRQIETFPEAAL